MCDDRVRLCDGAYVTVKCGCVIKLVCRKGTSTRKHTDGHGRYCVKEYTFCKKMMCHRKGKNMGNRMRERLEDCPVIAAVKDDEGLQECLKTDCGIVFILYGDIMNIASIVKQVKEKNKLAMVHMDLIAGLGSKEVSVDFIHTATLADGILSTKPALVRRAKELGLYAVMRFFVIDSMAVENIYRQCEQARPDCIEILPGVMPKVISRIAGTVREPVIAGGLITDKEDIMSALDAGAVSISTTNRQLWYV